MGLEGVDEEILQDFLIEASEIMPLLLFIGIGAMLDFGPLLSNPKLIFIGAALVASLFIIRFSTKTYRKLSGLLSITFLYFSLEKFGSLVLFYYFCAVNERGGRRVPLFCAI